MEVYKDGFFIIVTDGKTEIITDASVEEAIKEFEAEKDKRKKLEKEINTRYLPHEFTVKKWIREYRNQLLEESDWTQLPDVPLSSEEKQKWQMYRQQLRDFPQTINIDNIDTIDLINIRTREDTSKLPWPKKPEPHSPKA